MPPGNRNTQLRLEHLLDHTWISFSETSRLTTMIAKDKNLEASHALMLTFAYPVAHTFCTARHHSESAAAIISTELQKYISSKFYHDVLTDKAKNQNTWSQKAVEDIIERFSYHIARHLDIKFHNLFVDFSELKIKDNYICIEIFDNMLHCCIGDFLEEIIIDHEEIDEEGTWLSMFIGWHNLLMKLIRGVY